MSRMKFISNPETAVYDSLLGLKYAYPSLTVDAEKRIVIYNQITKNRVCLLSGAGSGHEPLTVGFVGSGMLSAAVAGLVFASPPSSTFFSAIRTLAEENNNAGVLIIYMNYTGDVLNFEFAAESAKAMNINVETVIIDDDCSRTGSEVHGAGKRGICGICFVVKIAGSMAESGKSLSEIATECRLMKSLMATLGVAASSCTVPGSGLLFKIEPDEVDIGLGIHGEAGVERIKIMPIDDLVETMLKKIISTLGITSGNKICVIVNNLCAVSQLEMGVIMNKVYTSLRKRDIAVLRLYSGSFITSLDMAGFQISILNITNREYWLDYLDSGTDAPCWTGTCQSIPLPQSQVPVKIKDDADVFHKAGPKFTSEESALFKECLLLLSQDLIAAEARLNELDTSSGDGDAGSTLKRLAKGIIDVIPDMDPEYPAAGFHQLAKVAQSVGGTSGALYGILLSSVAQYFLSATSIDWVAASKASLDKLMFHSKAKRGDRTMVDALLPAYEEFSRQKMNKQSTIQALSSAVSAAKEGCNATKNMKANLGRASYVPQKYITDVDPGAYGVTVWLNAILKILTTAK